MWYNKRLTNWFSFCIENPLHTWKKAKKYFKKPKWGIHFFSDINNNCPHVNVNRIAKIIDIESMDVVWKDKYESPRHERSPYIWVCLFRKFGFHINWSIYYYDEFGVKQNGDMEYWEYLLDYLYYRKNLKAYSVWVSLSQIYKRVVKYGEIEEKDEYCAIDNVIPTVAMSLNKKGIKELKSLL